MIRAGGFRDYEEFNRWFKRAMRIQQIAFWTTQAPLIVGIVLVFRESWTGAVGLLALHCVLRAGFTRWMQHMDKRMDAVIADLHREGLV